jgi:hypothetical protein
MADGQSHRVTRENLGNRNMPDWVIESSRGPGPSFRTMLAGSGQDDACSGSDTCIVVGLILALQWV